METELIYAQFTVHGETDDYLVAYDNEDGWFCNCPDRHYRKHACKHIRAVRNLIKNLVDENIPETQLKLV